MAQFPTTARTRRRERLQRHRERSPGLAVFLSVLTAICVCLLIFIIEINTPTNPLRNLFRLMAYGQITVSNPLYQHLLAQVERQDLLFATPFSLFCAGIVLGRLTPRRIANARLIRIAAMVGGGVILACIVFRWGLILIGQHGRLQAGELDLEMVKIQIAFLIGWLIVCLVGVLIGATWRNLRKRVPDAFQ